MSKSSWSEQLALKLGQAVERKHQNNPLPAPIRVALVGVGNELNGDDAAGDQVAAELSAQVDLPAHFLPVNAGSIPENAAGILRRFQPDIVIFIDAADFGGEVGEIRWLEGENIGGMSASSHTLPLSVLGEFLAGELNCLVEYLGIQPGQIEFCQQLTPEVDQAMNEIVAEFKNTIRGKYPYD